MGCAPSDENFDYDEELRKQSKLQSVEIKGDNADEKGLGPIHRNAVHPDSLQEIPVFPDGNEEIDRVTTLWQCFMRGVTRFGANNFLGTRKYAEPKRAEYVWQSYHQVEQEVKDLGRGLLSLGIKEKDTVGICAVNRAEWTMAALANYSQKLITVALYDTLGADALEYIVNHAEVKVVFSSADKLKQVISVIKTCPTLQYIVQFDTHPLYNNEKEAVKEEVRAQVAAQGVKLLGFSEVVQAGKEARAELNPPSPNDLAFIMYTSGTTGVPKGVMLTHRNVVACGSGALSTLKMKAGDVHISFLPLAHIFETSVQAGLMASGSAIGFFQGDVRYLTDDMRLLGPTVFCAVPRVFQRIYERAMNTLKDAGKLRRFFFNRAFFGQARLVRRGLPLNASFENFFAVRLRPMTGLAKCRLILTGAAPCPPYLMEFLKVVINPVDGICQGFGMTETASAVTLSDPLDHTLGHCGPPMLDAEVRLRDVPEMNYLTTNNPPTGEVLVRGPSIFVGYYKNKEATAETITPDGWLCTGDIGRWNRNGTLSIIDRKKNIFKLSHGEYVAAEKLEQVYGRCSLISQVFVYGNSFKPFILGIVVPAVEATVNLLKDKGLWHGPERLSNSPEYRQAFKDAVQANYDEVVNAIMTGIKDESKAKGLLGFEIVKDIHLELELDETFNGFTVENDCLTPTFKLRRPFLLKRYEQKLRDLYTKHGEKPLPQENWS